MDQPAISKKRDVSACSASLVDGLLTMSTGALTCVFRWNEGHLIGESIRDLLHDVIWPLGGVAPVLDLPDESGEPSGGTLEIAEEAATLILEARLRVTMTTRLGSLEVRRDFSLYPGCPLIGCRIFLCGKASGTWSDTTPKASALSNIESAATAREGAIRPTIMHRGDRDEIIMLIDASNNS